MLICSTFSLFRYAFVSTILFVDLFDETTFACLAVAFLCVVSHGDATTSYKLHYLIRDVQDAQVLWLVSQQSFK